MTCYLLTSPELSTIKPHESNFNKKLRELYGITNDVVIYLNRIETGKFTKVPSPTVPPVVRTKTKRAKRTERRNSDNPYRCSFPNCQYKHVVYSKMRKHMMLHSEEKSFTCSECSKAFKLKQYLNQHLRIHCEEAKLGCSFPGCHKKFICASNLKQHALIHTGERPYKCSLCRWKFTSKGSRKMHMETHEGNEYRCEKCHYVTTKSSYLKWHTKVAHTDSKDKTIKPYRCTQCSFSSVYRESLGVHLKVHAKIKPYSCTLCDYKCVTTSRLNGHIRTHTGEKPFSCSKCDFEASGKASVDFHFNKYHNSRVREYQCGFCPKASYTRGALNEHTRTHTGEKPYPCQFCGREFSAAGARKRHENKCLRRLNS